MKKPRKTKKSKDLLFQSIEHMQLRVVELAFERVKFHVQQRLMRA